MSEKPIPARPAFLALALLSAAWLGGCAGDGIELNGKLFDAMGVSSKAMAAKKIDPVVPERTGLVIPPSSTLPAPVDGTTAVAAVPQEQAWPLDPNQQLASARAEQERLAREKCEKPDPTLIAEGAAANHKYVRCGNIWTTVFNAGLDQPENAQGLKPILQQPQAIMVPANGGTIPAPAPDETATTAPAQ